MKLPALTELVFKDVYAAGLSAHKAISKFNSVNCRANFSTTVPKAIREMESEYTMGAHIIKNHRDRYKWMPLEVEYEGAQYRIVGKPEIFFPGYVAIDNEYYAVTAQDLLRGYILEEMQVSKDELEC